MYKVKKSFEFSAAHYLPFHMGKCQNLHGHNYVVDVKLVGSIPENGPLFEPNGFMHYGSDGMLLDFGDLKKLVGPVIEKMDHSFLLTNSTHSELKWFLEHTKMKVYNLGDVESTAENLSAHILGQIADDIFSIGNIVTIEVTVHETPNCSASYALHKW